MADEPVFLFIATYGSAADARADLENVRNLHKDHMLGTFDAAVVIKDEHGGVHVEKHEKPTQHAAWTGLAAGVVVGIIFPPSVLASAAVGTVAGSLIGHFWKGMSRKDVMELGDLLDNGDAALVIVGQAALQSYLDEALACARRRASREVDMEAAVLRRELAKTTEELE